MHIGSAARCFVLLVCFACTAGGVSFLGLRGSQLIGLGAASYRGWLIELRWQLVEQHEVIACCCAPAVFKHAWARLWVGRVADTMPLESVLVCNGRR